MGERDIDARADVYALGCVLYEMLAGEPPFTGPTAQSIVAKVITASPEQVTTYRKTTPPNVVAAVHTALEKLPADRFASAARFSDALADSSPALATVPLPATSEARRNRFMLPLGAWAVLATVIALWTVLRPMPAVDVIRYALTLPPSQAPDPTRDAIPFPDGSGIIYSGLSDGGAVNQLWIKDRDRHTATPIAGTVGVVYHALSPDGQWIAFIGGGDIRKSPVSGGTGVPIVSQGVATRPVLAWLDDGTIVYATAGGSELARVSEGGGTPEVIWSSDSMTVNQVSPLPDARGVLFQACAPPCAEPDVFGLDFRSGMTRIAVPGAFAAYYLATGHLAYVRRDGAMLAARFDLGSLEMRGEPVSVLDSISMVGTYPLVAISKSGTLVMRTGAGLDYQEFELVWVDRSGLVTVVDSTEEPFRITGFAANHGWALSPDGTQLAIGISTASGDDIWAKQLPRGPLSRVSYDQGSEFRPRWMPDGESITFISRRDVQGFYSRRSDGAGVDSLLVEGSFDEGAVSPDGRWYIFRGGATSFAAGGRDIAAMRVGIDTAPVPLLATPYDEEAFALSPDGRLMAYHSDETGRNEVFVRPFPEVHSEKRQVSDGGGQSPLWSRDSKELFYLSPDNEMMAVSVNAASSLEVGEPRVLFRLPNDIALVESDFYTPWDVAPDGRFIMVRTLEAPSQYDAPLIVVENWFEELKAKLGGR
jgi:serine/threonine-protein kinase